MNTQAIEKVSQSIEQAINECGVEAVRELPKFIQAIRMANGIRALREALTDEFMKANIAPLMGTKLGFLTDKDKEEKGYSIAVVRDCMIEAMLRGFNVVGNEFNIIAGSFYGAKAGFQRKVQEWPGLTRLAMRPGVPHMAPEKGGALVPFTASWMLDGKPMSMECQLAKEGETVFDERIPVKINAGMGADAILGKAERKMYKRIFDRLSGFDTPDGEAGDEQALITTGEPAPSPLPPGAPEGKRIKLPGAKGNGKAPEPTAPKSEPPPKPAAVDVEALADTLAIADEAWAVNGAQQLIEGWTEPQRQSAMAWAKAVAGNGPMAEQLNRPAHTLVTRQAGEEG